MQLIDHPSPNFNNRKDGIQPSLIILHYTGGTSAEYALARLTDAAQENKVSAHYMIDEEGNIYRLVDEDKRAWHAGVSSWNGISDVNSASIGIELSNRGHEPYTRKQLLALAELCDDIMRRHNIQPQDIIGHSDIAPDRKQDPGYHFPWHALARKGIGVIPKPKLRDHFNAASVAKKPKKLKKLFIKAGYGVDATGAGKPTLEQLVSAFQQHYEPHVFTHPGKKEQPGKPTASTVIKLRALARYNKRHGHRL
ncbi:MAG: N-acetylmuramoyl-L-alanine amidase [Proteobacteria bacterium]|nr:N-acetylmuramoyl-L-alanine amidase [Pseudomonadota bacterium]